MNAARRKALNDLRISIEYSKSLLDDLQAEEQDYYDNMPEGFQAGEKGEKAQAAADAIQEASDALDNAMSAIETAMEE